MTDTTPILRGQVSVSVPGNPSPQADSSSKWDVVRHALGSVLQIAAAAAAGYASGLGKSAAQTTNTSTNNLTYEPAHYNLNSRQSPVTYQQIAINQSQHLGQQPANQLAQLQAQAEQMTVQQAHQRVTNVLDQLAKAQGLPTYQEFHEQNGIAYLAPSNSGTLGLAQAKTQTTSRSWIQEDQKQIQTNLQYAQSSQKLQALQAQMQANQQQAAQTGQLQQAVHITWARPNATEVQQFKAASSQSVSQTSPAYEVQAIYHDLEQGPINVWQKMQAGNTLNDKEMKQLFHAIDLQQYGAKTDIDKQQAELLRLYAEQKLAENIVTHAKRDSNGNILMSKVQVRPVDAMYFALRDIQHFEETDMHLKPSQILTSAHSSEPLHLDEIVMSQSRAPQIVEVGKKEVIFVPPQVNIYRNVKIAQKHPYWDLAWFKSQVEKGGPWDYKQLSPLYENFGNFHYGIVGAAQGIPSELLKRAAGVAQLHDGHTHSKWGNPMGDPPYGDDPKDQYWIQKGIEFYHKHLEGK